MKHEHSALPVIQAFVIKALLMLGGAWTLYGQATPVSVTPNGGTGNPQVFQLLYTDSLGTADFKQLHALFTDSSGVTSCYFVYDFAARLIRLNGAAAWLTTPTTSPQTLSNSQCSVASAAITLSASGKNLTLSLPVTFLAAAAGPKLIWLASSGYQFASSGLMQIGAWTVPGPTISVSPQTAYLNPGMVQQFTANLAGFANNSVTWTVSPTVGTITTSGTFTAPVTIPAAQVVTVTAKSLADPTLSSSAYLTLMPAITVTVSPATASMIPSSAPQQFRRSSRARRTPECCGRFSADRFHLGRRLVYRSIRGGLSTDRHDKGHQHRRSHEIVVRGSDAQSASHTGHLPDVGNVRHVLAGTAH